MITERSTALNLTVLMPTQILLDERVQSVVVDAVDGSRGFLPRHIDFATVCGTGILSFVRKDGSEGFVALDGGVFVKKHDQITVCTPSAMYARSLGEIARLIEERAATQDAQERESRTKMARLETGFLKRFMELVR